jgi:serine protease Do
MSIAAGALLCVAADGVAWAQQSGTLAPSAGETAPSPGGRYRTAPRPHIWWQSGDFNGLGSAFADIDSERLSSDLERAFAAANLGTAWAPEAFQFTAIAPGRGSFLGVDVCEVVRDRMSALKLKEERGVEITRVQEDSPAEKAGLKAGDVVLEFNGQRVEGTEQFIRLVREIPAGREAKVGISRNGSVQTLTATMGARKSMAAPEAWGAMRLPEVAPIPPGQPVIPEVPHIYMSVRSPLLGIEGESLSPQLAEFFGVKDGVLVRTVQRGTAAEKAGIKAGDVITRIDGEAVSSTRDIATAMRGLRGKKTTFPVTVMRDRRETTLNVAIEPESSPSGSRERHPLARPVSITRQMKI